MHTLSDDKKDGYEIGILSLYPHRPEKEHSRNDFLSRGLPHQQAANEESTLLKGEKLHKLSPWVKRTPYGGKAKKR